MLCLEVRLNVLALWGEGTVFYEVLYIVSCYLGKSLEFHNNTFYLAEYWAEQCRMHSGNQEVSK